MQRTALITGIGGQDGAYLSELLLGKGYRVVGSVRRVDSQLWRLRELGLTSRVLVEEMDLEGYDQIEGVIKRVQPDEVYNLAARSSVAASFEAPMLTGDVNGLGVTRLLEGVRRHAGDARFYQASTCEMFGKVRESPQDEGTALRPRSPYAVAKAFGHLATINYRDAFGLFAASGILFNHESPLRAPESVTRKITMAVAERAKTGEGVLRLGNLNATRDWGYAGDYVHAMWAMLQADCPDDYVVATGVAHSVRDFVAAAFGAVDVAVEWGGDGVAEKGMDAATGEVLVEVAPEFFRPTDVDLLVGDATKAKRELGFEPTLDFGQMVALMVRSDLERLERPAQ